jgi:Co/Zn/Cd efflux system component
VRIIHLPRAALALAGGLFITFSQSHAAVIGLGVFAAFTLLSAAGTLVVMSRSKERQLLILSIVGLVAGLFAIFLLFQTGGFDQGWFAYAPLSGDSYSNAQGQLSALLVLVAGWALVSAAIEVYLASRAGFGERSGRDFLISGIFSAALAALYLLAAPDVVSTVGFFGAYLILFGVHWGIATAGEGEK